jgi:hypothetical protein
MKTIKVKTDKAFIQKHKVLGDMFQKSHSLHLKRLKKLTDEIREIQTYLLSKPHLGCAPNSKKMREVRRLDEMASKERKKGGRPKEFPEGVFLILEKKCPFCAQVKSYGSASFGRSSLGANVSPGAYPEGFLEVKRLNPGICDECAQNTASNSTRRSKPKGLWDSLFG